MLLLITEIFLLIIVIIILFNHLTNIFSLSSLGSYPEPEVFPKVSILVPARNEERNIRKCIRSLLAQDYPNFELLVLNDNSTDATGEILTKFNDPRLKVFSGEPLPEDWMGKHWACHQLAEKATSEIILFIDADTWHHPKMLRAAISAFLTENADFASALPKEEARSWGEKLIIPFIPWSLITFLPMVIARRTQRPMLSASIGQFMIFKKEAYLKIGGYSAIRDQVLDDVTFGRRVKSFGLRWRFFDGTDYITCRMYRSFRETCSGLGRYVFPIFKNNTISFSAVFLLYIAAVFGPLLVILLWLIGMIINADLLTLSFISMIILFLSWVISNVRFKFPVYLSIIYPITMGIMAYIAYGSMVRALAGKIKWKGRKIRYF
ncbi:MAG: glycosyltransferase [Nanoarchaeota archaeon]